MKIKSLKIFYIKKKHYKSQFPNPSFYKDGFVFIKLISDNNLEGFGEPSPYIDKPKVLISNIEKIFQRYFKNKSVNLDYTYILKSRSKNNLINLILPAFEQAIFDIKAKIDKTNVSKVLNKKNLKYLQFYASGGMIYENQSYDYLFDEILKAKEEGFYGYKFRPKVPPKDLNHFQRMKNPPKIDIHELEKFSIKLRSKIGDRFKIMIDLGCRISTKREANYLFKMFNEHKYFFVEEPFKRKFSYYKNFLKYKKKVKIAGGEHISSIKEFENWKKNNFFDFYQPDTNLLLYREIDKICKLVSFKKIILHNWCNKINFLSNINFAFAQKKKILIEKNIIPNPFDEIFDNISSEISNGKLSFQKNNGFGIKDEIIKNRNFDFYEKKI